MRILFFLVALTAVAIGTTASAAADQKPTPALSGHQLDRAVHDALRHWAKPSEDQLEPAAAIFSPCTAISNTTRPWRRAPALD